MRKMLTQQAKSLWSEIDSDWLETRRFELRTSNDGNSVPKQIWKRKMSSFTYSARKLPTQTVLRDMTSSAYQAVKQVDHTSAISANLTDSLERLTRS